MTWERYLLPALVGVWLLVLCWLDCRTRRLPNVLTVGGALVALVFRYGYGDWPALIEGFAAAAICGAFLLPAFLLRGAGGGDVKLLFAAGAVAGWSRLFTLLWVTSLAGVVLGVAMLAVGALDGARLRYYVRSLFDWRFDRAAGAAALGPKETVRYRVPFSIPIAVGLLASLLW